MDLHNATVFINLTILISLCSTEYNKESIFAKTQRCYE